MVVAHQLISAHNGHIHVQPCQRRNRIALFVPTLELVSILSAVYLNFTFIGYNPS